MAGFDMKDYIDVAERINEFSDKYPEGSLQSELTPIERDGVLVGWLCRAYAYRSPSDERPGVGHAVEPVPGKTPYTRDSEAMNAETSAWGRAIIALGFRTKKIASRQEVQGRQGSGAAAAEGTPKKAAARAKEEAPIVPVAQAASSFPPNVTPDNGVKFATEAQRKRLFAIAKSNGIESARLREILAQVTGQESTAQIPASKYEAVCAAVEAEPVAA
jgi:hypothetical protein